MKNKIEVTLSKAMFALSIFVFSLLLSKTGFAQASYELTCRTKAKEIAAETYKGCMTEQRQAQVEQIRKEYKSELAKVKSHYDKELKKLSSGGSVAAKSSAAATASQDSGPEITLKKSKQAQVKQRASGARSLPEKKIEAQTAQTQTQVIDLSSPIDSQINTQDEPVQSQSRIKSSDDNEVEIVELPTQE